MKKVISLILVLVICLSLCACGKSEAAKNTDALIESIGTVSLSSEGIIAAAEAAYNALSEEDKSQLDNYPILLAARTTLDDLLAQKKAEEEAAAEELRIQQVKEVAAEVDAVISAIGAVTLDSEDAVSAARAAYDALDEETKGYVALTAELEAAESELKHLVNQQAAQAVSELIAAIGTVTIDSNDAIKAASEQYDALSEEARAMVENGPILLEAIQAYDTLMEEKIDGMLSKLTLENDEVRGMKFYYASSFPYYTSYGYWGADVRSFVLPYLGMQGDDVWLRMVCDYTSSDWVFFEKITFAVDDERYYEYFDYYDVVRDNGYGDIWEYVDIEVGESELELLNAIANSEKTIVRFEGDDYYDDFVVSDKDKAAIKEMLLIYDYLKNK